MLPSVSTTLSSSVGAVPPESLLIDHIQAHVRKGDAAKERATQNHKKFENHYIAAGRYLATLKIHYAPSWQQWEAILKTKVFLSTGRASELMQLADGRKSLQEIRDGKAQSVRQVRAQRASSLQGQCSEETSEEADETDEIRSNDPAHWKLRAIFDDENVGRIPDPRLRLRAQALIVDLLDKGIRNLAIEMVLKGERQSAFDDFRNAVADLYQQLSRAGR